MQPVTTPVPSSNRFFALTAERLELIASHSLTMADLSVWAFIELASKPGALKRFTAASVADGAHVSLSAAKRSLARLSELGLIIKRRRSQGLWLCPASAPFGGVTEHPKPSDSEVPQVSHQPACEGSGLAHRPPSEVSAVTLVNGGKRVATSTEATPSKVLELSEQKQREAFDLKKRTNETASPPIATENQAGNDDLIATLERELGIWAKVGRRLVATFGAATVGERLTWARWMRDQGKADNPGGWLQAALKGSYAPPDGFHAAQQAPTPQRRPLDQAAVIARVMTIQSAPDRYTDDEKTEALRNACLVGNEAAAMRLAAAWGLSL